MSLYLLLLIYVYLYNCIINGKYFKYYSIRICIFDSYIFACTCTCTKHEFPRQSLRYKLITTLNEMSAETMESAKNYTQKRFVDVSEII